VTRDWLPWCRRYIPVCTKWVKWPRVQRRCATRGSRAA